MHERSNPLLALAEFYSCRLPTHHASAHSLNSYSQSAAITRNHPEITCNDTYCFPFLEMITDIILIEIYMWNVGLRLFVIASDFFVCKTLSYFQEEVCEKGQLNRNVLWT